MKLQLLVIILALPLIIFSQSDQGKIIYDETVKMNIELPEEFKDQLVGIIPDVRTTKKVLLFNTNESIYKDYEGQDENTVVETGSEESGIHMKMIIEKADNQLYKNFSDELIYEKQDFFGRDFLIMEDFEALQWKLISEQKEILGYSCQKAIHEKDEMIAEAWYTPQIPLSNGPMHFGQLPGMILELSIDGGETLLVATDILLGQIEDTNIEKPKKGKKVSREEFDEIVKQKTKEMEEEYGSGGNQVIIKTIGG